MKNQIRPHGINQVPFEYDCAKLGIYSNTIIEYPRRAVIRMTSTRSCPLASDGHWNFEMRYSFCFAPHGVLSVPCVNYYIAVTNNLYLSWQLLSAFLIISLLSLPLPSCTAEEDAWTPVLPPSEMQGRPWRFTVLYPVGNP